MQKKCKIRRRKSEIQYSIAKKCWRFLAEFLRLKNGAKECIVQISSRTFQRVFTCKNRRRHSRERAPRSLGENSRHYSFASPRSTLAFPLSAAAVSGAPASGADERLQSLGGSTPEERLQGAPSVCSSMQFCIFRSLAIHYVGSSTSQVSINFLSILTTSYSLNMYSRKMKTNS